MENDRNRRAPILNQGVSMDEIETGIELPDVSTREKNYPALYSMEVGQSFVRPLEEYKKLHAASQVCKRKTLRQFALRTLDDGKVRIWRTG